jgi:hypothetical protein
MRKLLFLFFFSFDFSTSHAQIIDTAALQGYSASVLIRIHEVAAQVSLSTTEQLVIAELFEEEEQALKTLVLGNATPAAIDSAKRYYTNEFNLLLSEQKKEAYYTAKAAPRAAAIAKATAAMLQQKYYTDTLARNNNLLHILTVYDTLISRYTQAAAGSRYFTGRVHYIDSIITIEEHRKNDLAAQYFTHCMEFPYRSYSDNFDAAFNTVFNDIADTAYYAIAYSSQIAQTTATHAQAAISGYMKAYQLSVYAIEQILPYIKERERGIALINKIYPDYTETKDSIVNLILQAYQPPIDNMIALHTHLLNASPIAIAIQFYTELALDEGQLEQLQAALETLRAMQEEYRQTDPFGEYDATAFESEVLNSLLDAEQYTYILSAKYYGKAASMAKTGWEQIQLHGIDAAYGFTETMTKTELTNYYLALFIAYYRNGNNPEEQYLSIQRINEVMPDAMRALLEIWEYQTPYGDVPGIFFQW